MWKKVVCFLVIVVSLYPILFLLLGSFLGGDEVQEYLKILNQQKEQQFISALIVPQFPTLQTHVEILLDTPEFFIAFWNTVKTVVFIILGQLVVNLPASWWFAQSEFRYKKLLYQLYVALMVLPFVVMMLPQYIVLKEMHLLDTLWAIVFPAIFSTLSVFIVYPYFQAIPKELLEVARLDGANERQIFFKIALPIAIPAIVISVILNFIEYWGSIEQVIAFIKNKEQWTLPLFLSTIQLDKMSLSFVASSIALVIPAILLLLSEEYMNRGMKTK